MKDDEYRELPIVYSCSGASNLAQLANRIAIELDREKEAEMSCIAGVGGGVKPLVKKAQSKRKIIAIDGCELRCVQRCLENAGVTADYHYVLTDFDLKKRFHEDYDPEDVPDLKEMIKLETREVTAEAV